MLPLRRAGCTARGSAAAVMHPPGRHSGSCCRLALCAETGSRSRHHGADRNVGQRWDEDRHNLRPSTSITPVAVKAGDRTPVARQARRRGRSATTGCVASSVAQSGSPGPATDYRRWSEAVTPATSTLPSHATASGQRESRRPRWLRVHAPARTQVSAPLMTSVSHLATGGTAGSVASIGQNATVCLGTTRSR